MNRFLHLPYLNSSIFFFIFQTLQKEIQGHQPRYDDIFERSTHILKDDSPVSAAIRQRLDDLQRLWSLIQQEVEKRHGRLEEAHRAQQYYFDAAEAEAWMSEQELYMMSEEKAKVRNLLLLFKTSYLHFFLHCFCVLWPSNCYSFVIIIFAPLIC